MAAIWWDGMGNVWRGEWIGDKWMQTQTAKGDSMTSQEKAKLLEHFDRTLNELIAETDPIKNETQLYFLMRLAESAHTRVALQNRREKVEQ